MSIPGIDWMNLPAEINEKTLKPITLSVFIRDRSPAVRFTGQNYVLPGAGRHKGRLGALDVELPDGTQFSVGTGFSDKTLRELHKQLRALEQDTCPFTPPPTGLGRPHWVKPSLVAQVRFGEWTADGRMRHPSFEGLREDKAAEEVVREMPTPDKSSPSPPVAKRPAAGLS